MFGLCLPVDLRWGDHIEHRGVLRNVALWWWSREITLSVVCYGGDCVGPRFFPWCVPMGCDDPGLRGCLVFQVRETRGYVR